MRAPCWQGWSSFKGAPNGTIKQTGEKLCRELEMELDGHQLDSTGVHPRPPRMPAQEGFCLPRILGLGGGPSRGFRVPCHLNLGNSSSTPRSTGSELSKATPRKPISLTQLSRIASGSPFSDQTTPRQSIAFPQSDIQGTEGPGPWQ